MFCKKQSQGFTLVELLTVIAVVAILAGLGGAAWSSAQRGLQKVVCASNMRQLGTAILLHAGENDGRFPLTMHSLQSSEAELSWVHTLSRYLEDVDAVRVCPADPAAEDRIEKGLSSYVLNEFLFVPARDPLGQLRPDNYNSIFKLDDPARTQMAFVVSDQLPVSQTSDHTHSRGWNSWSRVIGDIQPNRFSSGESASNGLGGSANYLYADGHVANLEASELRDAISSGRNPADPAQLY